MANRGLGSLTLDLIAKIGGFIGPLSQAERELDRRTKRMNKMAYDFGRSLGASIRSAAGSFLAFAGVSVSIGAGVSAIKTAIDAADGLRDASIRLGVGTEALSKWGYAARQTGTDMESLERGLKLLSKSATAALDPKDAKAGLFAALGVTPEALRDLNLLVPQVADAFKNMADGPQKAALAMELFGKSGADLIEFLNQGSDGLQDFGDKLERLGGVVTPKTAAAADDFNDKLDNLRQQFAGAGLMLAERLLPSLISLVDWLGMASDKSSGLGKAVDFLGEQAEATAKDFQFFAKTGEDLGAIADFLSRKWEYFRTVLAGVGKAMRFDFAGAQEAYGKARGMQSFDFSNVVGGVSQGANSGYQARALNADLRSPPSVNNSALDAYFAGSSKSGSSRKSGGKSKAQQEAEQLTAAYERLKASLAEQVALHGKVGETVRERYDLENGELAKLDPLRKAEVVTLLDKVDALHAEKAAQEELDRITKEREDAVTRNVENAGKMIEDMEFQLSLLSMTNDEMEREIALRYATADATAAQKARIVELTDALREGQKVAAFWEDFQSNLADTFFDVASGAKSLKDAVVDFFDSLAKQILRSVSEQWAEKITGLFKSNTSGGSSSGGNWIGSLIGALFGGGKASGGWASPGRMFEVNERGFEMATVGGRDYMLTGNKPVHITPNHRLGGGPTTINVNVPRNTSYETASQAGQAAFIGANRAARRNG